MKFATIGAVVASSCFDSGLALTETFVRSAVINNRGDVKYMEAAADNETAHWRDNTYKLCKVGKKAKCLSENECRKVASRRGKTFQVLTHSQTQRPCGCFRDSSSCCKKYVFWNPNPVGGHYSGYYRQYKRRGQKAWRVSLAEEGTDDVVPTLPEEVAINVQGEMIHERDPDEDEEGETEEDVDANENDGDGEEEEDEAGLLEEDLDNTGAGDEEADEDEQDDDEEQEGEALLEGDTKTSGGCKDPSSKRCQRKCGGDIIAYCNSYEDLKKAFCGGKKCKKWSVSQKHMCRGHFRTHGNKEIKEGRRPAPSCPGKALIEEFDEDDEEEAEFEEDVEEGNCVGLARAKVCSAACGQTFKTSPNQFCTKLRTLGQSNHFNKKTGVWRQTQHRIKCAAWMSKQASCYTSAKGQCQGRMTKFLRATYKRSKTITGTGRKWKLRKGAQAKAEAASTLPGCDKTWF